MRPYVFFHPYHVKPSVELVGAFDETRPFLVSMPAMEFDRRIVFAGYACFAVGNALSCHTGFQGAE